MILEKNTTQNKINQLVHQYSIVLNYNWTLLIRAKQRFKSSRLHQIKPDYSTYFIFDFDTVELKDVNYEVQN